ncbi:hypothetical protein FBY35_6270 [Streptomyces sp. SLBN-118]|nr:hypothetical protein FBY35_6270 [Streptomyces sp. SLBN-118]
MGLRIPTEPSCFTRESGVCVAARAILLFREGPRPPHDGEWQAGAVRLLEPSLDGESTRAQDGMVGEEGVEVEVAGQVAGPLRVGQIAV